MGDTDGMGQIELQCGCGAVLILEVVTPAQVEWLVGVWTASHPHSSEAQLVAAAVPRQPGDCSSGESEEV